jgi:hypothetical protein
MKTFSGIVQQTSSLRNRRNQRAAMSPMRRAESEIKRDCAAIEPYKRECGSEAI